MEVINNRTVECLSISPDNVLEQIRFTFDLTIDQKLFQYHNDINMATVAENMKIKCGCYHHVQNVAKALFPDQSFYFAFFESNSETSGKKFNKIASHIVNNVYNSDVEQEKNQSKIKCYGNCYILHIDQDFKIYDVGLNMFVNLYNKIHTSNGIEERNFMNRLFKKTESKTCYLYDDYKKNKMDKCIVM